MIEPVPDVQALVVAYAPRPKRSRRLRNALLFVVLPLLVVGMPGYVFRKELDWYREQQWTTWRFYRAQEACVGKSAGIDELVLRTYDDPVVLGPGQTDEPPKVDSRTSPEWTALIKARSGIYWVNSIGLPWFSRGGAAAPALVSFERHTTRSGEELLTWVSIEVTHDTSFFDNEFKVELSTMKPAARFTPPEGYISRKQLVTTVVVKFWFANSVQIRRVASDAPDDVRLCFEQNSLKSYLTLQWRDDHFDIEPAGTPLTRSSVLIRQ